MEYHHGASEHPIEDSQNILPFIFDVVHPSSLVDVGCGIGTFMKTATNLGASRVVGLDGEWVDMELFEKHAPIDSFKAVDLESLQENTFGHFDLALCLEVAEHISARSEDNLIDLLASLSDVVLFSAAIPGQRGQGHINEQWPSYWANMFSQRGYIFADVIRPLIWDDDRISWWYRQNIFLAVKSTRSEIFSRFSQNWSRGHDAPLSLIHPGLFTERNQEYLDRSNLFYSGGLKSRSYLYFLAKSVMRKFSSK